MPWVSRAYLDNLLDTIEDLQSWHRALNEMQESVEKIPQAVVDAQVNDALKKIARVDVSQQPLSLGAADKQRVREDRKREMSVR
jgi:hypothetical protein